jgi:hypothetical protein
MALYTVKTPYSDNWSKNPVLFHVGTTSVVSDSKLLAFSVQIQDYSTLLWEEIYTGVQRFDADSQSELDIARICDAHLEFYVAKPYDYSVTSSRYIVWKKQARNFRIIFWESDDQVATLLTSDSFYVVKGGFNKEQYTEQVVQAYSFQWNTGGLIPFLTWAAQPVYRDQGCLFFAFYMPGGTPISGGSVTQRLDKASGSVTTNYNFSETLVQGDVVFFFIDLTALPDDSQSFHFTINDGTPVSDDLILDIITRRFVYSKVYAYVNSLGGTEVAFLPYNQTRVAEQARDTFSRLASSAPVPYLMEVSAESFQTNQLEEITTGIDSGTLSDNAVEQMRELALSPHRYELEVFEVLKYIPVNVVSKKNMLTNFRSRVPLPQYFEITRAVRNSLFTPEHTDFITPLTNAAWEDVPPPVEDYFYMLIDPLDNPAQFAFIPNANIYVDYGDNLNGTVNSSTTHVYANNKIRKITFASLLKNEVTSLAITTHGKVSRIWGNLPRTLTTFKCNTQALTVAPALPGVLDELEIESNLLTLVPVLPPVLTSAKLAHNAITGFTTNDIPVPVVYFDLEYNELPVSVVNYILSALDTNGASNGTVKLASQTPAAAPTGSGITAAANLVGKGWTVTTD